VNGSTHMTTYHHDMGGLIWMDSLTWLPCVSSWCLPLDQSCSLVARRTLTWHAWMNNKKHTQWNLQMSTYTDTRTRHARKNTSLCTHTHTEPTHAGVGVRITDLSIFTWKLIATYILLNEPHIIVHSTMADEAVVHSNFKTVYTVQYIIGFLWIANTHTHTYIKPDDMINAISHVYVQLCCQFWDFDIEKCSTAMLLWKIISLRYSTKVQIMHKTAQINDAIILPTS